MALVLASSTGGVGRHVRSLAAGLLARAVSVTVLGPADTDARFGFAALGARFVPVEIPAAPYPVADARAVLRLRRQLRGAGLVHAHGLRAGLVAGLALGPPRRRRPPYLVTWHNALPVRSGGVASVRAYLGVVARNATARLADVTLGASPDLVESATAAGARAARFLPVAAPPLPPPERDPLRVRADVGAGERQVVLAVGRLGPQKDYPTLLDATAHLVTRGLAPLIVVAGDGPLRDRIAQRVDDESLPVRLLGHREDVGDLLRAADVVVLPSVWEARSLVAQEALAAGRPLVATAVGGTPELVGDAGLLVPRGDSGALAQAIGRVLSDPDLAGRLSVAGVTRAAGLPTEDDTVEQVMRLYNEYQDLGRS